MYDPGEDTFAVQCHEARQNACAKGWVWHIPIGQAEFLYYVPFLPDFCHNIVLLWFHVHQFQLWLQQDGEAQIGSVPLVPRDKSFRAGKFSWPC